MISSYIISLSLVGLLSFASQVLATVNNIPFAPTEYQFDTLLDHFDNGGASSTFKMRYIVNAQYWDPKSGPILFYAGNEGDVWGFYNNTGFMTETVAKNLSGLIVFGEHRYFGESVPFDKAVAFDSDHNKYLTLQQVMMDYVELLKFIRYQYGAMDKPCIVFGGSYGGMLAAWLRMKFPHVFQGALAASAPILYFKDAPTAPPTRFGDMITESFKNVSANCSDTIKQSFTAMMDIKKRGNKDGSWD